MKNLRDDIEQTSLSSNKVVDMKLKYEAQLDKERVKTQDLAEKLAIIEETLKGKDVAIQALTDSLF